MTVVENEHWQQEVLAEQVRIIYQQLYIIMYGGVVASLLFVVFFWAQVSQTILLSWAGIMIAMSFVLLLPLQLAFKRANPSDIEMKKWGLVLTLGLGVYIGTGGAVGALFYLREAFEYQLLLNLFVVACSTMLMMATSSYMPAYYATCVLILLPLFVRYLLHGDALHWELAGAMLVYWITLTTGCLRINQSTVKSLELDYHNQGLVEALRLQKEKMEEQKNRLIKQKEVAEQANMSKSRFLAAASHDLRQPLQAQALFVAELNSRLHEPEKCRVILSRLDESIHAMRGLFNALLDISKLDAGVVQPKSQDFKISSLLAVIKDEYSAHAREKGLEFKVRCSARQGSDVVCTDPRLLDSVLRNLVVNAIRYTQSGKVLVGCRIRGKYLCVEVWDTGPGIAEKYQQTIFEEFFQVENQQRDRSQGLGLGLSVVQRIAKLLNCPIQLDSIVGKGTRFSVSVLLSDNEAVTVRSHVKLMPTSHVLAGVRVAVIDDDIAIQQAMKGLLDSWGCYVLIAGSVNELLYKLSRSQFAPKIVIADYRLPGEATGVQTVQQVRVLLKNNVPAILITGDISIDKLQDVKLSGIPLMHKPVQPGKLRTLMQYLLTNHDAEKTT